MPFHRDLSLLLLLSACTGPADPASAGTTPSGAPLPACTDVAFAAAAIEWRLPFPLITATADFNDLGNANHALLDLTGDGRLDFVAIRDVERATPDPLVGLNHWLVFAGTSAGFSAVPLTWGLPYPLSSGTANQLVNGAHTVVDLDGDGLLDFVLRATGERPDDDSLLGKNHWALYRGTGSGFESEPSIWTLPYSLDGDFGDRNDLANGSHVVMDFTGDGRPDFVVLDDVERAGADALVGRNHWLVFEGTETGFATAATEWPLPYPLLAPGFDANDIANQGHTVLDLDGDGWLDFVVHRDQERAAPDPLVGKNHWLRFPGHGAGFDRVPEAWSLPFPLIDATMDHSDPTRREHALVDAHGWARPDFVIVRDEERASPDALTGTHHWPVFANSGSGFALSTGSWELPYPLRGSGFDANELATQRHAVLDIDGDGLVDFVEYANGERTSEDPLLGRNHWRVYRSSCED